MKPLSRRPASRRPASRHVPSRNYAVDKIRRLITHPTWLSDDIVRATYTILLAAPLSDGRLDHLMSELAQAVDGDLENLIDNTNKPETRETRKKGD